MKFRQLAIDLGMKEDEFLELVKLFIETSTSDLSRLQMAIDKADVQKAVVASHSIKGAAASLGLQDICGVAKKVEMNAREHILDGSTAMVRVIQEKLDSIAESLDQSKKKVYRPVSGGRRG